MFWLWPLMTVGTVTAAPSDEGRAGNVHRCRAATHHPSAVAKNTVQPRQTLTRIVNGASRDVTLHVTTTLSRTWRDLSRVFARMRDAIAYERWMHACFGWALSPMQRLMPSAAWPLAYATFNGFGAPTRGAGGIAAASTCGFGLAPWRGLMQSSPMQPPPWPQSLLPAPQMRKSCNGGVRPNDYAALAFAPMLGFAAGLQQMMPAMGFGLFA